MKSKKVIIVYNSVYYIYLFRMNLIGKLNAKGYSVTVIAPLDKYPKELDKLDFEFIPLKIDTNGMNPIADLKLIFQLYSFYKKISPDVILHFTIKPNIYGSIAARFGNFSVLNTITGLGTVFLNKGLVPKMVKHLYKHAFKYVDKVFFQNEFDMQFFIKNRLIENKKSEIIPGSGIDTDKFKPIEIKENPKNIIFLFIGRVIKDKGIIEYVEAAKIIKEKFKGIEFQIIGQLGSSNIGALSKGELDDWEKENIVKYLGVTEKIKEFISNADCIVLPSYREGTSRSLLEAASMAKPIITTNVPGCNNIVTDGVNGFLCKVRNSIDLAEKIKKMINLSNAERNDMGLLGREKMIEKFEENIVLKKYIDAVELIVNN